VACLRDQNRTEQNNNKMMMQNHHGHNPHHHPSSSPTGHTATTAMAEVSIYWDYENLPLKFGVRPTDASKAIVEAAAPFGRIVARRLYADMSRYSQGSSTYNNNNNNNMNNNGSSHWSALDSSGFDLVNTPRRNQKETVDKKMIADIFTNAWDSCRHCKPVVILLTGDGDFAYTLSKLRDRGVMSIVIHGDDGNVANILKASADMAMSFETDVLAAAAARRNQIQTMTATTTAAGGNFTTCAVSSASNDALLICKLVLNETSGQDNAWLVGSKLAVSFHGSNKHNTTPLGDDPKERYRRARNCAIQKGWLIKGRKSIVEGKDKGDIVSVANNVSGNNPSLYSMEDFYRVSIHGKMELEASPTNITTPSKNTNCMGSTIATGTGTGNTKLFVKNIPSKVSIFPLHSIPFTR